MTENPYEVTASLEPTTPAVSPDIGQRNYAGLAGTRIGLRLVYWAIVTMLVVMLLIIFGAMFVRFLGPGSQAIAVILLVGGVLIAMGAGLVMFVGQCFCLSVPVETRARGLITAAVAIQVINMVAGVGAIIIAVLLGANPDEPNPAIAGFQVVSGILGIVGFFCFLAFIRRVAEYIGDGAVVAYATKVIKLFGWLLGMYFLMIVVVIGAALFGAGGMLVVLGIMALVIFVMAIAGLCMYTTLLRNAANALSARIS